MVSCVYLMLSYGVLMRSCVASEWAPVRMCFMVSSFENIFVFFMLSYAVRVRGGVVNIPEIEP